MLVVACVAIIVVGPKDLPKVLRAFGKTMASVRKMAGDFQKQFDDAIKEAELDDVKNIATGKSFQALDDVKNSAMAFQKEVKERMADTQKSVNDTLPQDKLPEPVMPAKAEVAKVAAPVAPQGEPVKPVAKKAAVKTVAKKVEKPAVKATAKTTSKKAAAAGKKA